MELRIGLIVAVAALLLASSGCVSDVEKDSAVGQVLDLFGNFSSSNGSMSYEFSLKSLTNNTLVGPLSDTLDRFRENVTSREGVEMKNMDFEVQNITEDRAEVKVDYRIEDNRTGTVDRNFTLVFVKRNGQWRLKDPFATNFERQDLYGRP